MEFTPPSAFGTTSKLKFNLEPERWSFHRNTLFTVWRSAKELAQAKELSSHKRSSSSLVELLKSWSMCLAWIDTGRSSEKKSYQLYGCFKQGDASALNNMNSEQTLIGSKPAVKIDLSPNADGAIISLLPTDRRVAAEVERTIRNVFHKCVPHVSALETGPLPPPPQALYGPSTASAPARGNEHNASTQSSSSTQSKYSHLLGSH